MFGKLNNHSVVLRDRLFDHLGFSQFGGGPGITALWFWWRGRAPEDEIAGAL